MDGMYKRIAGSLLIVAAISCGFGYVLQGFFPGMFLQGVVAATIIQFIVFYFKKPPHVEIEEYVHDTTVEEELLALQMAPVSCPCGANTFEAPVFINADNDFQCIKCGSKFKVEVSYESVLVTEPLNLEVAYNALKAKELLYNKSKNENV